MPSCDVCPSVRHVRVFCQNKQTGSHTIPVFSIQYFDGNPLSNGDVEYRCGTQNSRFPTNIWLHRVLSTVRPPSVIHTAAQDRGKLVTLVAGKRRRLLFTGDENKVFMTRSLNVTPKTTEQHLIVRSGKSEAQVTNNCAQGIVLLKLTTDGNKASRSLSATAELLVSVK